ncbi:hypothetical protein VFPPC_13564 [Pochonia chlamydosporia 170]|uniref:Uncharacterized protein n=1 Tax=Pochonia chlamydosporia 170 TaxID=1380566 RepID=A0A179FRP2_METCM|nr:hypothetical protein VFPPC_13564 [Pochonia chlamydosporia 170]OAQ67689.1 hypothetical protein VFPPC_13564 [Pochonia chlamydosporia 170]
MPYEVVTPFEVAFQDRKGEFCYFHRQLMCYSKLLQIIAWLPTTSSLTNREPNMGATNEETLWTMYHEHSSKVMGRREPTDDG